MKRRQFISAGLAAASVSLVSPRGVRAQVQPVVRLRNPLWAIEIDPKNLSIQVYAAGESAVEVSRGVASHAVHDLTQDDRQASWTWGTYRIVCDLKGHDFNIVITASQPGNLDLIDQPVATMGRGMMLPLAEGNYVPANDPVWRDFLTDRMSELNTTQDLSLPLWGLDHGSFTLNWLLTNPFNNLLRFTREDAGMALKVSHEFTTLSPATPMTLTLHLATTDLMAGACRYRQHLIDEGMYETLASKIAKTPDAEKLLGASHLYLWGSGLIGAADVTDWPAFLTRLRSEAPLAVRLRDRFEDDQRQMLSSVQTRPLAYQKLALAGAFNDALTALARAQWQTDAADSNTLVRSYADLRREALKTFGACLNADPSKWGTGFSASTFAALQKAGLKRLWVGLGDGWEGGLWKPEVVAAGVKAGYLVAPYDSYETAIKPGQRPDWASAQLGKVAFETCGVIQKDGTTKSGFQQTGYYTNTLCVTPIFKARIPAVAKAAGYNSWFLDVYASGMVFDDYRPGHEMTMVQNASANSEVSRWISQSLQMPTGSEDGKAVTTGGILFAHGMQTPVIGWGDPDLQKNKTSPYYMGDWYPSTQPSVFFKPTPMKESYRALYFKPENRLPLYQSVFHGSVITTHHWLYDNLKLSNVVVERELAQLLYNVPPLYHLSADTLKTRLPILQKHDTFFRPLHEALALMTMDRFEWLSDDRLIQQTSFSDGSRLIANFDKVARQTSHMQLPPNSVTALLVGAAPRTYTAN